MKKSITKILALVLCFSLVACFAACSNTSEETTVGGDDTTANADTTAAAADYDFSTEGDYTADNTKYVIGATGPLTGDAASYGISVQNGATIAVNEINANGGLNGVEFAFEMKDDQATPEAASTGYDALFEAGMQVSLCSVTSGSAESFATRADEDGVFSLTPSGSSDKVINASDYAFRVCFGDPDQGVLAAEELTSKYEKIGAIYDSSDAYSTGIYDAFKAKMAELNVTYIEQSFDSENNRDFSTQVEALADCDVIFLPIYYTEAGLIAKACVAKGCDAVLFGCDGLDGVAAQIDETVTNSISYITPFDAASEAENVVNFVKAYEDAYGATPDQFAADAYDAVYAIYEAMEKLGVDNVTVAPDVLGDALVDMFTSDDFVFSGLTGTMTWDATGASTKVPVIVTLQ